MSQSDEALSRDEETVALPEHADESAGAPAEEPDAVFDSESDIIFNCPHCDHQLVIEVRGAGLTVNCTECGNPVVVPIPEGLAMSDLDESAEELFGQVLQLRRALKRAEERVAEMEKAMNTLLERRASWERARQLTLSRCASIEDMLQVLVRCRGEMGGTIEQIQALLDEERQ